MEGHTVFGEWRRYNILRFVIRRFGILHQISIKINHLCVTWIGIMQFHESNRWMIDGSVAICNAHTTDQLDRSWVMDMNAIEFRCISISNRINCKLLFQFDFPNEFLIKLFWLFLENSRKFVLDFNWMNDLLTETVSLIRGLGLCQTGSQSVSLWNYVIIRKSAVCDSPAIDFSFPFKSKAIRFSGCAIAINNWVDKIKFTKLSNKIMNDKSSTPSKCVRFAININSVY